MTSFKTGLAGLLQGCAALQEVLNVVKSVVPADVNENQLNAELVQIMRENADQITLVLREALDQVLGEL